MNEADIDKMVELYESGLSTGDLGKQFGLPPMNVRYRLVKAGVKMRSHSESKRLSDRSTLNECAFETLNPESAYWIGYIVGDGNVWKSQLSISAQEKDASHLKKFKAFMGSSNKVMKRKNGVHTMRVTSKKVVDSLSQYNVTPNKTFSYSPPEVFKDNRHFMRGLVDSDGSVSRTSGGLPLCSLVGNKQVVIAFAEFVRSIADVKASILPHESIYRFAFAGKGVLAVLNVLYQPEDTYSLDRKMQLALELTNRPYIK